MSIKQTQAFDKIEQDDISILHYGGAKGGGKSVFGCIWIFSKCLEFIDMYRIGVRKYPLPLAFVGRKRSVDFSDTTLETWKKFIPQPYYKVRPGDKEIVVQDRVKVIYGGFDDEKNVQKFQSAEYAYAFIDQAEEVSRDDIALLRGTFRLKFRGQEIPWKLLLTSNPAPCWLKDDFITSLIPNSAYIQALPADNPYLPDGYIDSLKEAFKHRPELIDAYVYGSWDAIAGANLVIKPSWVESAVNRDLHVNIGRKVVSCDPARFGDDETVIYVFEDAKIIDQMIYGQRSLMETAGNCVAMLKKHNACHVAIDVTGLGAGVADRLSEMKIKTVQVNFGSKASLEVKEAKYHNRRAEMWWEASEMFANEEVSVPDDMLLRRQLTNVMYKTSSRGRIQLESKADIKDRMGGNSPDRADAFVLGLHGLQFVGVKRHDFQRPQIVEQRSGYGWDNSGSEVTYGN